MKISIVIPVYNVGELLHKSVDSVLPQTNSDCEIIIVDDGSTDDSGKICDEYSRFSNVRIIHKQNGGLSSARNVGIDIANGEYLLFLDSDDYLRPGSIALLLKLAKQIGRFDFIQFHYDEVSDYSDTEAVNDCGAISDITDRYQMFRKKFDLGGIGASACTKLISRHVFDSLRFKEGIIHEDELFTIHLINQSTRVFYISSPLYMYVQRPRSIITSGFTPKRLDIIPVLKEQIDVLKSNNYDDLVNLTTNKLFTSLCIMYVEARRLEYADSVRVIKDNICTLLPHVIFGNGRMGIIAKGMKMHLPMLPLYYWLKKIRHE